MEKKVPVIAHESGWIKDVTDLKHESVPHFAPEQMVECAACRRQNPPTRLNCFYCGERLEISEKNEKLIRPVYRKLENWEKGFNVACFSLSLNEFGENELKEVSAFLGVEATALRNLIQFDFPLPIARVETAEEARIIENRLKDYGLNVSVVADENLSPETAPRRIRALEFADNLKFRLTGANELDSVNWQDLTVFVEGRIFESRREAVEKRKKGEATEIGEASEFSSDERVLDFYDAKNPLGFRISAKSFDFSCLGAKKSLLANENFEILLDELKQRATVAAFDQKYKNIRSFLNDIWATDERRDSTGLQHVGVGKVNFGSALIVNNQNQFNRYSRLRAFWEKLKRQK